MIIKNCENFRSQFYDVVRRGHVLLLVNNDVDSLCSSMILTKLFTADDVSFSLTTVWDWPSLSRTLAEQGEQSPSIVLINCGGTRSLLDLNIPENSKLFVLDSRRPIHHENVYNDGQIVILMDEEEEDILNIPSLEDVIPVDSDEESSDEDDDEEGGGNRQTRMQRIERRVLKKEIKRNWERKRGDLLWKYYESTWFSMATSVRMLELSATLNRANSEHMWLAAVGLNSQWSDKLISTEYYTSVCIEKMRPFIYKFSPKNAPKADDVLRIAFEKEIPLALYSQWSLYKAMMVNDHFACKTRNWTQRGDSEVKHMLATLGLTLNETKQTYEAMTADRKKEVFSILEKEMSSTFATFFSHLGYCKRISALDVARATTIRLEIPISTSASIRYGVSKDILESFFELSNDFCGLRKAAEAYKGALELVWGLVSSAINQSEVLSTGPFYLYSSRDIETDLLESRHFLYIFSRFLLKAFAVSGRNRGRKPLIVSFPLGGERRGFHMVTGVMPLDTIHDDYRLKCYIGRAFNEVRSRPVMADVVESDSFDDNVITIRTNERSRFFEILQTVMDSS